VVNKGRIKVRNFRRYLKRKGARLVGSQGKGSHEKYHLDGLNRPIIVPTTHNELSRHVLLQIGRTMGMTLNDLYKDYRKIMKKNT